MGSINYVEAQKVTEIINKLFSELIEPTTIDYHRECQTTSRFAIKISYQCYYFSHIHRS